MTMLDNEQIIRRAYKIAEDKDVPGWVAAFTADGTLLMSRFRWSTAARTKLGDTIVNYATAFPDMHREIYQMYASSDVIVPFRAAGTKP